MGFLAGVIFDGLTTRTQSTLHSDHGLMYNIPTGKHILSNLVQEQQNVQNQLEEVPAFLWRSSNKPRMSGLGAGKIGPGLFVASLDIKERRSSPACAGKMSAFSVGNRGRGNTDIPAGGLLFPRLMEPSASCLRSILICFLMTDSNVTMCPSSFSVRSVTNEETLENTALD